MISKSYLELKPNFLGIFKNQSDTDWRYLPFSLFFFHVKYIILCYIIYLKYIFYTKNIYYILQYSLSSSIFCLSHLSSFTPSLLFFLSLPFPLLSLSLSLFCFLFLLSFTFDIYQPTERSESREQADGRDQRVKENVFFSGSVVGNWNSNVNIMDNVSEGFSIRSVKVIVICVEEWWGQGGDTWNFQGHFKISCCRKFQDLVL